MDEFQGSKRASDSINDGNPSKRMALADETLFRLLVPDKKIGSVIGKGGKIIKQLREESGARIKVADSVGGDERVVMISGKDDPSLPFSVAQEALFQIHQRVYEGELPEGEAPEGIMTTRMLVEGSQAGSLIGKGGKIIKMIREGSGAQVRVLPPEEVPPCGGPTDRVVQIVAEHSNTRTCLQMISKQLRENPAREKPLVGERPVRGRGPTPQPQTFQQVPQYGLSMFQQPTNQMLGIPGMLGMGGLGGMAAPLGQMGGQVGGAPMPTINSRITVSPLVIGSVIGKGGSNIQQIRTLTGAKVKVHDKEPGEEDRVIEMSGSADQVTQAQQLVQAFIANGSGMQQGGQVSQGSYGNQY